MHCGATGEKFESGLVGQAITRIFFLFLGVFCGVFRFPNVSKKI